MKEFIVQDSITGEDNLFVEIPTNDGFISMPKATYDEMIKKEGM